MTSYIKQLTMPCGIEQIKSDLFFLFVLHLLLMSSASASVNTVLSCPNPACGHTFDSFETICAHIASSPCGEWLADQESNEEHGV